MFDKAKGMMAQLALMQKLMKDENFKAFISHPKVQEAFRDPDFQEALKQQDTARIFNHPKLAGLRNDAELLALLSKLNLKDLNSK